VCGLEIVGLVASIVHLADSGSQVAVKLNSFYYKDKEADLKIKKI
jgi:hypothetical protein